LIWAEAERLSGLNVDDANFKSERDVVKEEYRQGVLAPPYGRFEYLLQQKSFLEHPYKRPTIGSIEDLDAASLKDVQEFHATYYRPDNALVISSRRSSTAGSTSTLVQLQNPRVHCRACR
jgi:zinc protease